MHSIRWPAVAGIFVLLAAAAMAQEGGGSGSKWRSPGKGRSKTRPTAAGKSSANAASDSAADQDLQPTSKARVTEGSGSLPNEHGQVWREYDISPYTLRVTSTARPEQAIVDWILRETGYEVWHGEPVALLSATGRALRVYHTPEMQATVGEIVDRFVSSKAESQAFGLKVISVGNPSWRARAGRMLVPLAVQTQGIQAWLMQKEDAALLLAELRRRADFREHSMPHLLVNNGQSSVVVDTQTRGYTRDILFRPNVWPGFESQNGQYEEGFSLELNPLLSSDGRSIDAVIKCHIDQLEKLIPVQVDVPTNLAPRQRVRIDVPQVAQFRLQERFRWPVDQVLVVGLGVVATPVPAESNSVLASIPVVNTSPLVSPTRADLLIVVESKGPLAAPAADNRGASAAVPTRGRY